MSFFLEDLAQEIRDKHPDHLDQLIIVLPTRRAGLFLKKHLARQGGIRPFFSPRIWTIDEFFSALTPLKTADQTELLFLLYQSFPADHSEESFDRFLKWGNLLLNDFNEVDRYLVNPNAIFSDIRNIKEIEEWSLGQEGLTETQEQFVKFWNTLLPRYESFKKVLIEQGKCYNGLKYRVLAEDDDLISRVEELNSRHIYFAGFNAMSASEKKILKRIVTAGLGTVFFDGDVYYVNDENHEAGYFIRELKQEFLSRDFKWIGDHFSSSPKKVRIVSAPGNVAQARVAGEILAKWSEKSDWESSALILGDESLLLPVLNSIPEEVPAVNVTMGFSLRYSDVFSLYETIFQMQKGARHSKGKGVFHADLKRFLLHPVIRKFLNVTAGDMVRMMIEKKLVYVRKKDFDELDDKKLLGLFPVIEAWRKVPEDAVIALLSFTELLRDHHIRENDQLRLEYVFLINKAVRKLKELLEKYPYVSELSSLHHLFRYYSGNESVDFIGEPLEGVQLMGLLETRALDFKRVIITSVNEEILPKGKNDSSFIPFDVKLHYELPTYRQRDALIANHFYRVLQRAEEIWIVYNSEGGVLGGEKSRFVLQLESELLGSHSQHDLLSLPAVIRAGESISGSMQLANSEVIRRRIKELLSAGISPSALNTFVNCPLDFYYQYVLGIREKDEVEETVDQAGLGNVIHDVLEKMYEPFIGSRVHSADVERFIQELEERLKVSFRKNYPRMDLSEGRNLLVYRVAFNYLKNMLNNELRSLDGDKHELKIEILERFISSSLSVQVHGENVDIVLRGKADRVDRWDGQLRVIDYKTGSVGQNEMNIKSENSLTGPKGSAKGLQLLAYAHMVRKGEGMDEDLTSGIWSLRKHNSAIFALEIDDKSTISDQSFELLKSSLQEMVEKMLDPDFIWSHNLRSDYCEYCS